MPPQPYQRSRFLSLPWEVFREIYSYVLGGWSKAEFEYSAEGRWQRTKPMLLSANKTVFTGLLLTSRQVYDEVSEVLYNQSTFLLITDRGNAETFSSIPANIRQRIRRMKMVIDLLAMTGTPAVLMRDRVFFPSVIANLRKLHVDVLLPASTDKLSAEERSQVKWRPRLRRLFKFLNKHTPEGLVLHLGYPQRERTKQSASLPRYALPG
ncbi:hypothetical protein VTO42DRAFT_4294 [Malbranchea cinnamomea]